MILGHHVRSARHRGLRGVATAHVLRTRCTHVSVPIFVLPLTEIRENGQQERRCNQWREYIEDAVNGGQDADKIVKEKVYKTADKRPDYSNNGSAPEMAGESPSKHKDEQKSNKQSGNYIAEPDSKVKCSHDSIGIMDQLSATTTVASLSLRGSL